MSLFFNLVVGTASEAPSPHRLSSYMYETMRIGTGSNPAEKDVRFYPLLCIFLCVAKLRALKRLVAYDLISTLMCSA